MNESRYLMAGIIAILLGLIAFSYYKRSQFSPSQPSTTTYHQPSTSTSITTFTTTQPYILKIGNGGQTLIAPRVIFTSIETILITTSTTFNNIRFGGALTTYAYVTPTYTYYKNFKNTNLFLTTQITYNVQYGEYNIEYGGSTSTVAVYTPIPQSFTTTIDLEVLNINGTPLTTYNGTVEFPTTITTTYVYYTHQVPIGYTYYNALPTTSSSNHTTALSVPITVTTQVVFSLPSQVSIEGGKGHMVISIFVKNVTDQFKVGANICESISRQLGSNPVTCLTTYSSTTNEETNFVIKATADIALSRNTSVGIKTNSTTFIPAQYCSTAFGSSGVEIQSATATYNGGKYKLEIEPQVLSFSLDDIHICSAILVQQVNVFIRVPQ